MRALPYLIALVVSLWLGGLVSLFVFVATLFPFDRPTALVAAPRMFHVFERYQLILAGISIALTIAWRMCACSKSKRWLTAFLIAGAVLASVQAGVISPKMNEVRFADPHLFQQLHRVANVIFITTTLCATGAMLMLIAAITRPQQHTNPPQ